MSDRRFTPPSRLTRIVALVFVPLYLWGLSILVRILTGVSGWTASIVVAIWAGSLIAVIGLFAARYYLNPDRAFRFRVSTVLLFMVMVAIYMAGYRWIVTSMSPDELARAASFSSVALFVGICLISTVVLLCFSEAVVWVALSCKLSLEGFFAKRARGESAVGAGLGWNARSGGRLS